MSRRMGPGSDFGKAKDFKKSVQRLFKELKKYRILIIISLILAVAGSVFSIFAPNKLSDLTDEISKGLIIDTKSMEELTTKISSQINEKIIVSELPSILSIDLSNNTINKIMTSSDISSEEKRKFQTIMDDGDKDIIAGLSALSDDILKILLPKSTYKDNIISSNDKISLIRFLNNDDKTKIVFPASVIESLLSEIEVEDIKINPSDEAKFISEMAGFESLSNTEIYEKLDKMPVSIKKAVDPFMDIDMIKSIGLFLLILYLCSALFTYIESVLMTVVSNRFAKSLRSRISIKINKLPLKYFDNHAIGDTLSRITNDIDTIAQSMNQSLATLVSAVVLFLGTIIMMFITNWIMAITAIVASLVGFSLMILILGKSQKYFVERQVELGNLNGHIEETYSGLNVVKVYNGKKLSDEKFDLYNEKVFVSNRMSQFLSGLMMPIMGFIGNFGYVAICIVGALLAMNGSITFGIIVAFITYVRLFTSPLSQIAQAMTSIQSTAASSERVFEFLDEDEMSDDTNINKVLDKPKGNIEFKNVIFTYDGNDKPTINNFSAKACSGQKIAIVGPTGAGKTTIVNLLMKFYEINSGEILIDGVSTKELSRNNIHKLFTMVLQDTWLFEGSVLDNIRYNRENISEDRVKEVCKIVGVDHFIKTLPDGYNSIISNTDSVSSGQRQLLTIARGMIEDSPFLILDEATSNVDTRTEELVQSAMDKLSYGKTSFIIAHRLSTIKNADLILVMKDGNIVEQGNHDELMKQNGFYANLYNSQFEL